VTISPEKFILQRKKEHCAISDIHLHTLYVGFMVGAKLRC